MTGADGVDEDLQQAWTAVDGWFAERLAPADPAMEAVLAANARAGLPAHDVSPLQGRLLALLVRLTNARRVLEIGTLGGFSTLHMARALAPDGRLVTLEADPHHAAVSRANFAREAAGARIELRQGRALELLPPLARETAQDGAASLFDLVFIDADKASNPDYLAWALQMTRLGGLIVADNVVRSGAVTDADSPDPSVQGARRFTDLVAAEPRLLATALQTVGLKGWDGLILALVIEAA